MMVMRDEREAIRSLFLYNEMTGEDHMPDYDSTPYWGYEPDETETRTMDGMQWEFSSYYKDGYSVPFVQLVLADDSEHRPRKPEAEVAWEFFRHFGRDENGKIIEFS